MTFAFLVLALLRTQADPLARYAAFQAAHPTQKFDFTVKLTGVAGPTGTILIERPHRLFYRARFKDQLYTVSETEQGYVEIERSTKIYDSLPAPKDLGIYTSDVNSLLTQVAPQMALLPDLKPFFNPKSFVPETDPNLIHIKQTSPMGSVEVWAKFDEIGHLESLHQVVSGPQGHRDLEWDFSNFSVPIDPPISAFLTPIPVGSEPRTVPRISFPMQKHQTAPVAGWVSPSGQTCNFQVLAGNKPFLLAVVGDESPPSDRFLKYIRDSRSPVPIFVVGKGEYRDPDGSRLAKLNVTATPMIFRIGSDGKVQKLWLGFDGAHPSKFEQEMETDK